MFIRPVAFREDTVAHPPRSVQRYLACSDDFDVLAREIVVVPPYVSRPFSPSRIRGLVIIECPGLGAKKWAVVGRRTDVPGLDVA
jgi:hypothetical protein